VERSTPGRFERGGPVCGSPQGDNPLAIRRYSNFPPYSGSLPNSAILPVGHMAGAASWYVPDSAHWVISTYYSPDLPD
jgi:hypothetical protein